MEVPITMATLPEHQQEPQMGWMEIPLEATTEGSSHTIPTMAPLIMLDRDRLELSPNSLSSPSLSPNSMLEPRISGSNLARTSKSESNPAQRKRESGDGCCSHLISFPCSFRWWQVLNNDIFHCSPVSANPLLLAQPPWPMLRRVLMLTPTPLLPLLLILLSNYCRFIFVSYLCVS